MKTKKLFRLPLLFLLLVSTTVLSQDFVDGNFTFRVNSDPGNSVTIMFSQINGLQNGGVLNVPATASNNGTTFNVTRINGGVFAQSSGAPSNEKWRQVNLPHGLLVIGQDAFRFNRIESLDIPSSVRQLDQGAFRDNEIELFRYVDQNGNATTNAEMRSFGNFAFRNNNLEEASFSNKVNNIGGEAFDDNPIRDVTVHMASPPALSSNAFNNRNLIRLEVTVQNSVDIFRNSSTWANFLAINGIFDGTPGQQLSANSIIYRFRENGSNDVDISGANGNLGTTVVIDEIVTLELLECNVIDIRNSAFLDRNIESLTINSSTVERIRANAFRNNNIETITFGPNVGITIFEADAFNGNNLTDITIPASVNVIDGAVFRNNPIETVRPLSDTPPTLAGGAFQNNDRNIIQVSLDGTPNQTQANSNYNNASDWQGFFSIDNEYTGSAGFQFFADNGIRYITTDNGAEVDLIQSTPGQVPSNLTIDNFVFRGVSFQIRDILGGSLQQRDLTTVTINSPTVRIIRDDAFRNNQISTLTFGPDVSVVAIENDVFNNNNLTDITIPASVGLIGNSAFATNPIQKVITTPINAPILNGAAFDDRRDIVLEISEDGETLSQNSAQLASYEDSGQWNGFFAVNGTYTSNSAREEVVDLIAYRIIQTNSNVVDIIGSNSAIPPTLTIDNTIAIKGINFTIVEIEGNAFSNRNLTSVTINASNLKTIRGEAFRNNNISQLTLNNGLEEIQPDAFNNALNDSVTEITIPATVVEISDAAFTNNAIQQVNLLGSTPPSSSSVAFTNRTDIRLEVPNAAVEDYKNDSQWSNFFSVNGDYIGGQRDVTVNEIIYRLQPQANDADMIGSQDIGNTLTIPAAVTFNEVDFIIGTIDENAFLNKNLINVTIAEGIVEIKQQAFRNNSIVSLELPTTLKTIEANAFRNNQLVDLVLPEALETLGNDAFNDNPMVKITSENPEPPSIEANTFRDRSLIDLFVPTGRAQAYELGGWDGFKSINEFLSDLITLNLKVYLQGATLNPIAGEEDLMRDDLRSSGLVPTISPFNSNLFINSAVLDIEGSGAIVDWVFVEFRDESNNVVDGIPFLLQRDGTLRGAEPELVGRRETFPENMIIAIYHRNHIPIITANPIATTEGDSITVDFTDPNQVQGGENALVEISKGIFAMIAGDFDENGQIQPSDVNQTTAQIGTSSYSNADMDMNGQIQPADVNNLVNPNVGRGVQFTTE